MSKISFGTKIIPTINQSAFVATIGAMVRDKSELLHEFSRVLLFPEYFGNNWDALNDCLCDLTWIKERGIVIVFESISHLDNKTQEILIDILNEVVQFWNINNELHDIEIIINE